MADWPVSAVKRAENAERDMATALASAATLQARSGARCISANAVPIGGLRNAASQPK